MTSYAHFLDVTPGVDLDTDQQLFLSDPEAKFSKSIGWADEKSGRTGRYAIVIDHGKVQYAQVETEKGAVKVFSLLLLPFDLALTSRFPAPIASWPICNLVDVPRNDLHDTSRATQYIE